MGLFRVSRKGSRSVPGSSVVNLMHGSFGIEMLLKLVDLILYI